MSNAKQIDQLLEGFLKRGLPGQRTESRPVRQHPL